MIPQFNEAIVSYLFLALVFMTSIVGFFHRSFYYANVFQPSRVFKGKGPWTLVTSALIHGGWPHLLLNMAFCLIFMAEVEYMLVDDFGRTGGRWILVLLFIAIVAASNLIDGYFLRKQATVSAVGLSGFTCAMIIFYYAYFPLDPYPGTSSPILLSSAYHYVIAVTVLCAVAYGLRIPGNQFLHLIGCLIGMLAAAVIRPQAVMELIHHFWL